LAITFLRDTYDGQMLRAKAVSKIKDRDAENHENLKFLCMLETMTTMISLHIRSCLTSLRNNTLLKKKVPRSHGHSSLTDHQGPMSRKHKDYKGASSNVLVK
jgi:hypothetical protein